MDTDTRADTGTDTGMGMGMGTDTGTSTSTSTSTSTGAGTDEAMPTPEEQLRIAQAVKDRLVEYWWDVDRDGARRALEFYTEDCVYLMCEHRMEGHAAIRRYYDYRDARGPRLVRHVITNLLAQVQGPDRATVDAVLSVYAADGVPVLPTTPPIMIADNRCEFVRGTDGVWRFRLHRIIPLFRGGIEVLAPPGE
ncbi:MAG TPA: hypothetical protein PK177_21050 [Burkholderiaceae bacterium]|nr:hypothetical protein [Burkholderiaceae bacterium]